MTTIATETHPGGLRRLAVLLQLLARRRRPTPSR
jgi:hypothetical protein